MTSEEQKNAVLHINLKLAQIDVLLAEAVEIAEKADVTFELEVSYGMGGRYIPTSQREGWGMNTEDEDGWYASSESC